MGIIAIKLRGKVCRILLLLACICAFTIVDTLAQRKINCRKQVYAPECRGIAAKRDIGRIAEDYRYPVSNDRDYYMDAEKQSLFENSINMKGLLGDLLRKAIARNQDYDTGNGNYLK